MRQIALLRLLASVSMVTGCGVATDRAHVKESAQNDDGSLSAYIPEAAFSASADPEHAGKQKKANWCWAAVSQMILAYHHMPMNQQDLVTKLFGGPEDRGASIAGIVSVLDGLAVQNGSIHSTAHAKGSLSNSISSSFIADELAAGRPLLLGLQNSGDDFKGHAYAVISADYRKAPTGEVTITQLTLIDPLVGNATELHLSGEAFDDRFMGLVTIDVAATSAP